MKALMKVVLLASAFMLFMHSVVPHFHHRHLAAADMEVRPLDALDFIDLLSLAFHNNHSPKDLEELRSASETVVDLPPVPLSFLADWALSIVLCYPIIISPIYWPEDGLPVKNLFSGGLIISRPPPSLLI